MQIVRLSVLEACTAPFDRAAENAAVIRKLNRTFLLFSRSARHLRVTEVT